MMAPVNRVVMLRGIPLLRDIPGVRRLPGIRGLTNIRHIDFPDTHRQRLAAITGPGKATFFAPNHPEFFTDWMIDKEVLWQVSPLAAAWATHGVVNGLGTAMQKFWLANNLIAQIPGNAQAAREHSVVWSLTGNGVLLHPEGAVGWHGDHVAPLLPGAVDMAAEALRRGREREPGFEAWVAPVAWKLAFVRDEDRRLLAECSYVERRLGMEDGRGRDLPRRVFAIYEELLARAEAKAGVAAGRQDRFAQRQTALAARLEESLRADLPPAGQDDPSRLARRWLRENRDDPRRDRIKKAVEELALLRRVGGFAFARPIVTQEELAEHLKRIRNDYCAGTFRDTFNRFVPQPAGPRRAIIRVPEPMAIHQWAGTPQEATEELRRRLQGTLDAINADLAVAAPRRTYSNPFHEG